MGRFDSVGEGGMGGCPSDEDIRRERALQRRNAPSAAAASMRETRMIERALRQRWPIKEEWRATLLERQARIASDPGSSPREATSAFKAILAADQINLNAELGNVEERLGALEDAEAARREGNNA